MKKEWLERRKLEERASLYVDIAIQEIEKKGVDPEIIRQLREQRGPVAQFLLHDGRETLQDETPTVYAKESITFALLMAVDGRGYEFQQTLRKTFPPEQHEQKRQELWNFWLIPVIVSILFSRGVRGVEEHFHVILEHPEETLEESVKELLKRSIDGVVELPCTTEEFVSAQRQFLEMAKKKYPDLFPTGKRMILSVGYHFTDRRLGGGSVSVLPKDTDPITMEHELWHDRGVGVKLPGDYGVGLEEALTQHLAEVENVQLPFLQTWLFRIVALITPAAEVRKEQMEQDVSWFGTFALVILDMIPKVAKQYITWLDALSRLSTNRQRVAIEDVYEKQVAVLRRIFYLFPHLEKIMLDRYKNGFSAEYWPALIQSLGIHGVVELYRMKAWEE